MVHIGRPGEDGFTERVLASWGVDGHNSHTNVCSSGGRTGFQFWMGIDRPSPDHANAKVIYLISAHLESGHYFNPHAQRITQARENGAKVIVLDTRLSNTATHAVYWLAPQPGSEAAINLAIANHLTQTRRYDREFVRRWWNWAEYLTACHSGVPVTFGAFEEILSELYAEFTFSFAAAESGIPAETLAEVAEVVAGAGPRFSCHSWRSAAAGTSAAGRCRARFSSSRRCSAPWRRPAAPSRTHGTSSCRGPSTCRRIPACGRNCPGRWNTRWRRTRCRSCCRTSSRRGAGGWTPTSPASTTRSGPTPTG